MLLLSLATISLRNRHREYYSLAESFVNVEPSKFVVQKLCVSM